MAFRLTTKKFLLLAAVIVVCAAAWSVRRPDFDRGRADVNRWFRLRNYERAEQAASNLLLHDPDLPDIRLIAAESAARLGHFDAALDHLRQLSTDDRDVMLPALLLEAELAESAVFDLKRAESAWLRALELDPDSVPALEGLVRQLAICGRRRDAIPYLLRLVRLQRASDLLTIAARGSGAINDSELLQSAMAAFPDDSRVLTGLALQAERNEDLPLAIEFCRKAIASEPEFVPAMVNLGTYLLAAENFEELQAWQTQLLPRCRDYAETWRVLGYLARQSGHQQRALACFLEAAGRGPELKDIHHRLAELLRMAGDPAAAEFFAERLRQIQQLEAQQDRMFAVGPAEGLELVSMIRQFQGLGRLWEAFGWTQVGLASRPQDPELRRLWEELAEATAGLPLELVAARDNPVLKFQADSFSLPDVMPRDQRPASESDGSALAAFSFRNDAESAGLTFQYLNGVSGPTTHRMFEFTGGGIGVLDFDEDDFPDLFLTQGCLWEERGASPAANDVLFRNLRGERFVNAAGPAGITDRLFGQGVATGDINNDGFPDVFVSNIGSNGLWINNGDGTFSAGSLPGEQDSRQDIWTTSAAVADLNGDGGADIYATNYLSGADVYERVCRDREGREQACFPTYFEGQGDNLYWNDLQGGLKNVSSRLPGTEPGKGLGVLAWSPANDGRLTVLVANDTTPNFVVQVEQTAEPRLSEAGFAIGLAVNGMGKAEGCMGIAAGDLNDDGRSELLVTNFYNETNTLYQSVSDVFFEDRTSSAGLADPSLPALGFGTQFLDANLDGRLEMVVANGHVDDLRREGKPYQMPTQFFTWRDRGFYLYPADSLGKYFENPHLGRSVVCLDWNVDGLADMAVGHLSEDYALLTNTCADAAAGIMLRCVGTESSRDAIGVTVSWRLDDRTVTRQLTGGDGYHASNQHDLWLGCGGLQRLAEITVIWPSGQRQTLRDLAVDRRYVVVEGRAGSHPLPSR